MDNPNPQSVSKFNPWLVATLILALMVLVGGFFLIRQQIQLQSPSPSPSPISAPANSDPAAISGTITYSGLQPESTDIGSVSIYLRPAQSDAEFTDTGLRLTLQETTWSYPHATAGENYEVYALLTYGGVIVSQSTVETITAPALSIPLDFDIHWQDLGLDPNQVEAAISGSITVNGYIPPGSQLSIIETNQGQSQNLTTVAVTSQKVNYTIEDVRLTGDYALTAALTDRTGQNIGTSTNQLTANMSDSQVNFQINSSATPPAPTANIVQSTGQKPEVIVQPTEQSPTLGVIAGRVILNGPLDENSRLLVLGKTPSETDYHVWHTIPNPHNDGQTWRFDQAIIGQAYDIQVALQVDNSNVSSATPQTVTAPAADLSFTLNTNFFVPAPTAVQIPYVEPCYRAGDRWETYITLPKIGGARQYWLQVGDHEGYSNYYNQKLAAPDGNLRLKVNNLPGNVKFFVRYSFSDCRNCRSDHNFSPWSGTVGFTCQ